MVDVDELKPQYVTDADGNRTAVLIPIETFEQLIEDLEDLATIAERRDEPTVPHEEVVAMLDTDDCLPT